MSTTGTEKHCRLSCMLIKAGTKTNCAFLEKRVQDLSPDPTSPWSLDDFLKTKQKDIQKSKLSKEKYRVLFPANGATDIKKWDLSLLCHILVQYCHLNTLERLDVEQFRNVRNELCHVHEPNIDDDKFKNDVELIEVITTRILEKVDNTIVTDEVKDIINEMKEGPLSIVETVRTMHIFYSMERDIREKLDTISDAESRLLQAAERIEHKLDSSVVLRADPSHSPSVRLPAVDFYIDIKNIGAEKEARLSKYLVELFEARLKGNEDLSTLLTTMPPECFQQLRATVNETFKIFLSRGWEISEIKHDCVLLKIQCRTISAVVALFREFAEGRLLPVLKKLEKRCSMLDGYSFVELEPVIYRDTFFDVMEETFSSIEDNILKEEIAVKSTDTHSLCLSIKPRDTMHLERLKSKQTLDRIQCSLKTAEQILVPHLKEPRLSFESSVEVKEQTPALKKGPAQLDHESRTDGHLTTLKEIDKIAPDLPTKVDSDSRDSLQTIALLEIYKSQRAIAYYLELSYLSFFDYPEIKKEVLTASQSAREKHRNTADSEWPCLVNKLNWELEVLTNYRFSNIDIAIKCACRLKAMTEELQKSYIELQDIIRNLIKLCENFTSLHKHKEAKARNKKSLRSEDSHPRIRRMMIEKDSSSIYSGSYKFDPKEDVKAYTFVLDKHTEIAKYSSKHYKGKSEMNIFKQEDRPSKWAEGESWRKNETLLTMLRPGSALTGGISSRTIIKPDKIFESICCGEELEILERAYRQPQEDTEAAIERKHFVQRMHVQRKDALERLETIKKGDDYDIGIECLGEVDEHLKYIDIQFGRINNCWSKVIFALRLLKTNEHLDTFMPSDMWIRQNIQQEEWHFVDDLFFYYCRISEREAHDLFRFIQEPIIADPVQRRRDLFLVIGKEISGTYRSPHLDKSSDQRTDTVFKGRAKLFPGEEISETYLSAESGKSSDQHRDTDVKGKAKLFPEEKISETYLSSESGK